MAVARSRGATPAAISVGQGVGTIVDDEPRVSINDVTKSEGKKNRGVGKFPNDD